MPKIELKDIFTFLKMFGISSLFFIAGIVICFLGPTKLGIDWPAYIIIGSVLIVAGIIVLIIETIKYIKTHDKKIKDEKLEDIIQKSDK